MTMKTNVLGHEVEYDGTDEHRAEQVSGLMCQKKSDFHEAFDLDPVDCGLTPDPEPEDPEGD